MSPEAQRQFKLRVQRELQSRGLPDTTARRVAGQAVDNYINGVVDDHHDLCQLVSAKMVRELFEPALALVAEAFDSLRPAFEHVGRMMAEISPVIGSILRRVADSIDQDPKAIAAAERAREVGCVGCGGPDCVCDDERRFCRHSPRHSYLEPCNIYQGNLLEVIDRQKSEMPSSDEPGPPGGMDE